MSVFLRLSTNQEIPYLFAFEEGLYFFNFIGDQTYLDDQGVTWNWEGVASSNPPDITGVRTIGGQLLETETLDDCKATQGSFFYDNNRLYIHYIDSVSDFSQVRADTPIQVSNINSSNSYDLSTKNFIDGLLYQPTISDVDSIEFGSDPLKLGLLGATDTSINLNNSGGLYDDLTAQDSRGAIIEIESDGNSIFKGFTTSITRGDKSVRIRSIEQRFFQDAPVNRNLFSIGDFPNIDSKFLGKGKPVALGDIRRGVAIPVNTGSIEKDDAATVRFVVSDSAIGPIRQVSALYDSNGNEVTISASNLSACWIEYAKPAGVDVDLSKFTWSGQGHNLGFGTYNNGVDIIRFAFAEFAVYPYISTTFDQTQWQAVTDNNAQAVGLSIYGNKGITESIIEPIATSLQIDVLTKGNGQVTAAQRDIDAPTVIYIDRDMIDGLSVSYDSSAFVSELEVHFAPNFSDSEDFLAVRNTEFSKVIFQEYGDSAIGRINPVKTVLYNQADADSIASEIMVTSKAPEKRYSFTSPLKHEYYDLLPYDIMEVEVSRPDGVSEWVKLELLSFQIDSMGREVAFSARYIRDSNVCVLSIGNDILVTGNNFYIGCV